MVQPRTCPRVALLRALRRGTWAVCRLGREAWPQLAWGVLCCDGWGPSGWEACGRGGLSLPHPSLSSCFSVPRSFAFASAGVGSKLMSLLCPGPRKGTLHRTSKRIRPYVPDGIAWTLQSKEVLVPLSGGQSDLPVTPKEAEGQCRVRMNQSLEWHPSVPGAVSSPGQSVVTRGGDLSQRSAQTSAGSVDLPSPVGGQCRSGDPRRCASSCECPDRASAAVTPGPPHGPCGP